MSIVTYQNKYPNVIVFTSKDYEGILAAFLIKQKYDNNLQNELWDRNVQVFFTQEQDIQWYKKKVEQNLTEGQQNIVFIVNNSLNSNQQLIQFWNWIADKELTFQWFDDDINSIQNLKHLHIPGKQSSLRSTLILLWETFNPNIAIPKSLRMLNEYSIPQKNSSFSLEKELIPLTLFLESLGKGINDNKNELLINNLTQIIESKDQFLNEAMFIGRFIYNYKKQKQM